MRKLPLRALLPFLLLTPLLTIAAAPDIQDGRVSAALVNLEDGVPAVGPSDAQLELRSLPFGDVTAMLEPGQALIASGVTCVQDTAWLSVSANGQSGWVLADFVTLQATP